PDALPISGGTAGRADWSHPAPPSRTTASAVVGFIVAGPGPSLVSHAMSSRQPASAATPMTMAAAPAARGIAMVWALVGWRGPPAGVALTGRAPPAPCGRWHPE